MALAITYMFDIGDNEWDTTEVKVSRRTHDGAGYAGSEVRSMDGSGRAVPNYPGNMHSTRSVVTRRVRGVVWDR